MPMRKDKLILLLGMICLEQSKSATLSLPKAPTCGRSLVRAPVLSYFNIFSRIVGGSQVEKGSYPWQVSLKKGQKHICGGTIIFPQWVVTAAHCTANRNIASALNVTAGEYDLSHKEPGEQTLAVEIIIVHPNFSTKRPMDYDVALLKMAGTFHFDQFVRPLCLPEPGERFEAGLICTTTGWGRLTETGNLPQVLQEVSLPIITQEECMTALSTLSKPISGQTFLCTGFPDGGRDACQGDSGGSLMCRNKKGAWTLAGVTSWGLGCGRGWRNNVQKNDQGSPGIFTDLSKVLPWIHKHIQIGKQRKSSSAACSGQDHVVSQSEGELHFPESPNLYYENMQICVWTLVGAEEMHLLLYFFYLDVESCDHTHLLIYSDEDRIIGKLCGQRLSSSMLIGSNSIRIRFASDGTDHASGFNLTYQALKPHYRPDSGCGSLTVLFEEGSIQSLHYPEEYSDMANCNWVFQAPKHYIIKLSFQNLEIEESGDCTSDFVEVYRDVERKQEIARLCGFVTPGPVLSNSGVMFISFQSDEKTTFRGFQATVSFIPEKDLNISISEEESMFLEAWNVLHEETFVSAALDRQAELVPRIMVLRQLLQMTGRYHGDSHRGPGMFRTIYKQGRKEALQHGCLAAPWGPGRARRQGGLARLRRPSLPAGSWSREEAGWSREAEAPLSPRGVLDARGGRVVSRGEGAPTPPPPRTRERDPIPREEPYERRAAPGRALSPRQPAAPPDSLVRQAELRGDAPSQRAHWWGRRAPRPGQPR
ncbi:ovochymase-2 [Erinaceus europaeus]|uniref:Ovochymase-2 n=1 Tax=Erinaceus europaeus TaxID=9365 RepID=A0A1S3A1F4_ERIEU|nr:ovochymase-2 [Erinaceus europaeus]